MVKNNKKKERLLIICGPTAAGKTGLGIFLAKKFGGEIISADSRQVYKGMDIGTGKDISENEKLRIKNKELGLDDRELTVGYREKSGVPVWLVDAVEPDYKFNVGEYAKLARTVIDHLWQHNKLPVVVGGSGLYIKALTEPLVDMEIPPNHELRRQLQEFTLWGLQGELQQVDLNKWEQMNTSDRQNPRRLVRAIEMAAWKKNRAKVTKEMKSQTTSFDRQIQNTLLIGLTLGTKELHRRIEIRVENRVKQGIVREIYALKQKGYEWDLPALSGLGYKEWKPFFKKINGQWLMIEEDKEQVEKECIRRWKLHEEQYAGRQKTWFRKMKNINWFDVTQENYRQGVVDQVEEWYNKQDAKPV